MNCFFRILFYLLIAENSLQHDLPSQNADFINESSVRQKMKRLRIKSGSSRTLNCNKAKDFVTWQFKACDINYGDINCDGDIETESGNQTKYTWKFLKSNSGKKTLTIKNATVNDTGIYRCIDGNVVMKAILVEIDAVIYGLSLPKVQSVEAHNNVIYVNNHLTISCNVFSKSPPKILWFKECWTSACDMDFASYGIQIGENYNCLCLVNDASNNSTYNFDNYSYKNKLHIFNAHIWDGGTYVCSALSSNGKDYKSVFITVEEPFKKVESISRKTYLILLFIPLSIIMLYIISHICCAKKKKERDSKQMQHLMMVGPTHVISAK